jgi:sugar O-acyltransferase (sialic acid O-acetyltransferase NeuD family)
MIVNKFNIPSEIIFWGASSQARSNRGIVEHYGSKLVAVFDDTPNFKSPFSDVPLYQGWEGFLTWIAKQKNKNDIGFSIAIGNPHGRIRLKLHDKLINEGLKPVRLIHPSAYIDGSAEIGEGSQIMAGAIVAFEAKVGKQCIVNSNAVVEHECDIADAVEIQPGATVLGLSRIGENSTIGTGAIVLSRLNIGSDVTVGAGTVVSSDIANGQKTGKYTERPI